MWPRPRAGVRAPSAVLPSRPCEAPSLNLAAPPLRCAVRSRPRVPRPHPRAVRPALHSGAPPRAVRSGPCTRRSALRFGAVGVPCFCSESRIQDSPARGLCVRTFVLCVASNIHLAVAPLVCAASAGGPSGCFPFLPVMIRAVNLCVHVVESLISVLSGTDPGAGLLDRVLRPCVTLRSHQTFLAQQLPGSRSHH